MGHGAVSDFGHGVRNVQCANRAVVAEKLVRNRGQLRAEYHAVQQLHLSERVAAGDKGGRKVQRGDDCAGQEAVAHAFQSVVQGDGAEDRTAAERLFADGADVGRNIDRLQRQTALKGEFVNRGDAGRKIDRFEQVTAVKGGFADGAQRVGEGDALDVVVVLKGSEADGRDVRTAERCRNRQLGRSAAVARDLRGAVVENRVGVVALDACFGSESGACPYRAEQHGRRQCYRQDL